MAQTKPVLPSQPRLCSLARLEAEIARTETALQTMEVVEHRIEDAVRAARLRRALRRGSAVAEQPLEHDARVVLGRHRRSI